MTTKPICEGCEEKPAEDTVTIDGTKVKVCRDCYSHALAEGGV